ncbi:hypothetical protein KB221_08200 [Aquidulcibacter paucihalophilus]|nr:hypothetical protein KB221_08200 [Aquidulcibacter paucihalophilus]
MWISLPSLGRVAVAASLVGLASPVQAQEASRIESRFSSIWPHDCTYTDDGAAEGQDWVSYRCEGEGGIAIFLGYSDGVRLSLGFGAENPMIGFFSADREPIWPVEWRGRVINGRFVPHGAIARMKTRREDDTVTWNSELVVFGLSGRACVLGEVHGARENERARQLADTGSC